MANKRKTTIRMQIFAALSVVIFIMAAIFSPYGFYTNVSSIRKSVDERLFVAVNGLNEILPANYHNRLAAGKVSSEEYAKLQRKVADFQKRIGVTYLYAMVKAKDGKIHFTMDTDVESNKIYEDPSPDTLKVFETRKPVSAECEDETYGIASRSVLLPFYTPDGELYVLGCDLNVQELFPMIRSSLINFFLLLGVGILLVAIITVYISKKISMPIRRLSNFTKELADSNFSQTLSMDNALPSKMKATREVSMLADSISAMRKKLSEYIESLKIEIFARNIAESELKIAGSIQESFLPGRELKDDNFEISAYMKPAKQAGGDLYDFFKLDDGRICFAIGDVSGKGMPAALFMTRAMTLIRSGARMGKDISFIANFMNDMLSDPNDSCTFVTFFICAYNSMNGELEYVNCGHNPPYEKLLNGKVRAVKVPTNRAVGVFGDAKFKPEKRYLDVGSALICYTDGVTEAMASDSSFYGDGRLENLIGELPSNSEAEEIVGEISKSVSKFESGAEQSDDITILVIKRKK